MADTNFSSGTVVASSWLDDVNTNTYAILSAVAGTNTITATGASTVTVGYPRGVAFRFIPQNTNTGAVTVNISGLGAKAVTKYGTTPLVAGDIVVGSWAYIAYDGTQFQLVNPLSVATNVTGRLLNVQRFLASGTYTPTAGTTRAIVELVGGGGAGGGAGATGVAQQSIGSAGGAGAYTKALVVSPGVTTVTVGAGGTPASGAGGGSGTASSFGASITAPGGSGGQFQPATPSAVIIGGGNGGAAGIGGNILQQIGTAAAVIGFVPYAAGPAIWGAQGATGPLGGNITGQGVNANGIAAPANSGSGGSGTATIASQPAVSGGAGGSGIVIVYEYS